MEGLGDLLAGRLPEEPPEIKAMKRYVREQFDADVSVALRERETVVLVQSAALANALRLRGRALQQLCPPGTKLVIRIGRQT